MKTKLLKKCRRKIKLFERNGKYYVDVKNYINPKGKTKEEALKYYRIWILETAYNNFGFKPKRKIF